MSANFEAKKVVVNEIKEKLSKAKSVAFVGYDALTVEEDTKMRREFKANGAEYKVYKNRLMLLALNELGIKGAEKYLEGTSAVAFGYDDEVAPAKIVCDYAEKTKKLKFPFRDLSKYYYLVHPMIIYLLLRFDIINIHSDPYWQIILVWLCTHIISLFLITLKRRLPEWPI